MFGADKAPNEGSSGYVDENKEWQVSGFRCKVSVAERAGYCGASINRVPAKA
jgi:hypothetical protein